jgi:O-antigen/teichoic acid export membrane protein
MLARDAQGARDQMNDSSRSRLFASGTAGAVRAGAVIMLGWLAVNGANYLYQLVAARWLGAADFGIIATLAALVMILTTPYGAVQLFVARDTARALTARGGLGSDIQWVSALAIATSLGLAALIAATAPLTAPMLQITGLVPMLIAALMVVVAVPPLPLLGVLQGRERYLGLTATLLTGAGVRLLAVVSLLAMGAGLYGALGATVIGGAASIAVGWILVASFPVGITGLSWKAVRRLSAVLAPMAAGILAITALANTDIIVVKGALSAEEAGIFGAVGLVAKITLFVPAAIIPVVQSRVARRDAQGRGSKDILMRTTLATLAFGLAFSLLCGLAATPLMEKAFGPSFADGASILALYCVVMTALSVAALRLNYFLTRGELRLGYVALVIAALQALGLVIWHDSLSTVLLVDGAAILVLLLIDGSIHGVDGQKALRTAGLSARRQGPTEVNP